MTSRDRVKAAVERKPGDRPPYFIHICQDAWETLQPRAAGLSQDQFLDNDVQGVGIPWWNWHELGDDWRGADAPASQARVIGTGGYSALFDEIKASREKSDKYLLAMVYGSHFEKAYAARGIENFLADMAGQPQFAGKLLNRVIEKNLVMLENVMTLAEIDGVLLGSDWGTQLDLLMSPETWDDMIRPGEQKEYDLIHSYGKDVWIHSCGKIDRLIPRLIEMGVNVLNPIQPECMDINELAEKYGDRLAFWGGISTQKTLPYGSPDDVRCEARRVRRILGRRNGYVLAPSQSIQSDVPPENISALLEVAREQTG